MPKSLAVFVTLILIGLVPARGQSLSSFQWKNRILVLMDPDGETEARDQLLLAFRERDMALADRDLLIFCYDGSALLTAKLETSPYRLPEELDKDFKGVILIGKDGGVKLEAAYPVGPQSIFSLIDSMPMRRAEIRRSKKH